MFGVGKLGNLGRTGGVGAVAGALQSANFILPLKEAGIIPLRAPAGVVPTYTRATTEMCPDFEDVPGVKTKWNLLAAGEVGIWGARRVRNVARYTEDITTTNYSVINATKVGTAITSNGKTLKLLTSSNFYGALYSNFNGLGQTPFVIGRRYLVSCYVISDREQFVWMRDLVNSSSNGHGAKLIGTTPRRIWILGQATSTSLITWVTTPTTALGGESGLSPKWIVQNTTESGAMNVYIGGFQINEVSQTYKDGIALIGDSTMAGASASIDWADLGAREVSTWFGALLSVNVFNRALAGNQLSDMDTRWAADITPLAVNCKYVVIQGGVNDIPNGRTLGQMQTSINSMAAKAATDGMTAIYFNITPSTSIAANQTYETLRLTFNAWLAATYPNTLDIATIVADPSQPSRLNQTAGWVGDGIHYGSLAKRAIGEYVSVWSGWDFICPEDYVSVDTIATPFHGFGIDGVKNFWTTNVNIPTQKSVGEPIGTPITAKGYWPWPAATQLVTPTADIRDMTGAGWVKVTMTTAYTSVGIDGAANSATRCTASGANSTILKTLTAAASSRTYSTFIRRVTGTGTILLKQGATTVDITSLLNTVSYTRVELNASVLDVAYGIQINTSGDAIDVDFNMFEAGSVATPPIETAGATRNADVDSYQTTGMSVSAGTIYLEYTPLTVTSANRYLWGSYTDASNALQIFHDGTNFTARKRIAAANNDAVKATALAALTRYKIAIRWGSTGTDIFVNGVKGTNSANTTNAVIAATMQIGADGNSANQADGGIANDMRWDRMLTDAVLLSLTT